LKNPQKQNLKMSTRKNDLGKGISALLDNIKDDWSKDAKGVLQDSIKTQSNIEIPLTQIEINPFQPRTEFNKEALQELAESVMVHGVIQPITVRQIDNNKFQLISGERRLRASKMVGKKTIPAYVRKADDQEMLEIALIENIQREDLNAVEIAINYKRLIDECNLTQEEMANRIGKNRSTVTNYLRLLKLPPDILSAIKSKKISMGHARAIINVEDPVIQLDIIKETIAKELSVREVEKLVKSLSSGGKKSNNVNKGEKPALPLAYRKIQDELSTLLSTKVQVKRFKNESGEITISFYSDDDLNRLLDILGN
jgi:ParB family transcriptional regulator, chromosome partitioning protein